MIASHFLVTAVPQSPAAIYLLQQAQLSERGVQQQRTQQFDAGSVQPRPLRRPQKKMKWVPKMLTQKR